MRNQVKNVLLESVDNDFWGNIMKASNDFINPGVFQFSNSDTTYKKLKNISLEALNAVINNPVGVIRIYIDGKVISDPFRFLRDNPKLDDESIKKWKKRISPDKSLVLKTDKGVLESNKLRYALSDFLRPVIKEQGIPLGGINISFEFGDHKWSPEGLEEDLTPKRKIYINLGNTKQNIYEWTPEKQEEIGGLIKKKGKVRNFDAYTENVSIKNEIFEDQLATLYNTGMFIIEHEDFYINMKILFNDLTKKQLLQQTLFGVSSAAISSKIRGEGARILPIYDKEKHSQYTLDILKKLQYADNDLNLPMIELLRKSFKNISYAQRSNLGFITNSFPKEDKEVDDIFKNLKENTEFSLAHSLFKIENYVENNKIHIFMRGQRISMKHSNFISQIIDTLNNGLTISWVNILDQKESGPWNENSIKKLLQLIYKYGSVHVINDN